MKILLLINCVLLIFMYVVWKKSDWVNLVIKTVLLMTFLANAFYLLVEAGYIFKA